MWTNGEINDSDVYIAYFIAGKIIDKLAGWTVEAALTPMKNYLTEKGRGLLSRWLHNPREGEFQGGLTAEGKAALNKAIRDACQDQKFDQGVVEKIISKIEADL